MTTPTLYEIITVALAHDLKEGEVGFTGLTTGDGAAKFATSIPLAAAQLARLTHAPSLTRSEEHTSELQSLMRISYAVFCLKKNNPTYRYITLVNTEHL